jgi:hypothetical protein
VTISWADGQRAFQPLRVLEGSPRGEFDGIPHRAGTGFAAGGRWRTSSAGLSTRTPAATTRFVGQVEAVRAEGDPAVEPLLYYRGRYGRVQPQGS